jgi:hypothetical protein
LVAKLSLQERSRHLGFHGQPLSQIEPNAHFLQIKFYWNTATPTHLHIACSAFVIRLQSGVFATESI